MVHHLTNQPPRPWFTIWDTITLTRGSPVQMTPIPQSVLDLVALGAKGRHALLVFAALLRHRTPHTRITRITRRALASDLAISDSDVDRAYALLKAGDEPLIETAQRGRGRAEVTLLWLNEDGSPMRLDETPSTPSDASQLLSERVAELEAWRQRVDAALFPKTRPETRPKRSDAPTLPGFTHDTPDDEPGDDAGGEV